MTTKKTFSIAICYPFEIKEDLNKTIEQLKSGDFTSAEIKKIKNTNFFRAKIDFRDRLLNFRTC